MWLGSCFTRVKSITEEPDALQVDEKKANRLSQKAIIIGWHKLFKGIY